MPNERLLQKKGQTDRQTDRQTDGQTDRRHKPRVEVSLDGIPTTGLREEVSRLVFHFLKLKRPFFLFF